MSLDQVRKWIKIHEKAAENSENHSQVISMASTYSMNFTAHFKTHNLNKLEAVDIIQGFAEKN